MAFSRERRQFTKRNRNPVHGLPHADKHEPEGRREVVNPEQTGSEARYLKSLVDSHREVTVVLNTGERFQGRIRYYDDCLFSLGLSAESRRLLIRKDNVSCIVEETAE